jgi:peptidoglycan/xylan/chitin deacetylase (PgdA/CDA1 family)
MRSPSRINAFLTAIFVAAGCLCQCINAQQEDQTTGIEMVRENGVLKVPVQINGVISLKFVIDSGASVVQVPKDVFLTLIRTETIRERDFLPGKTFVLADGSKVKSDRFVLRSIKVGESTISDVEACVGGLDATLLLGQSFLSRFKEWKIDNNNHKLILTLPRPSAINRPLSSPAATVGKTAQVVVLGYHGIENAGGSALSITPELFERHMQRLRDQGIHVISMQDFLAWRRNEKTIPAKSALITVDDGYASAFDAARPILKKFKYPWTCFIYTKYVGSGGKSITWQQLATLRDEGVEIGCHTVSHLNLREMGGKSPEAYAAWLHDEIIGSKQFIETKLGIRCAAFAYPDGRYNSQILEIVKEAGFSASFTIYGQRITHTAPPDRLGRYFWYSRRPQDIELALTFSGPVGESIVSGNVEKP